MRGYAKIYFNWGKTLFVILFHKNDLALYLCKYLCYKCPMILSLSWPDFSGGICESTCVNLASDSAGYDGLSSPRH